MNETVHMQDVMKVFWLSFCDVQAPEGQQFLGGCLIDVTAEDADDAAVDIALKFPFENPDTEWIRAAINKSHRLGCNPGGEVATVEIDPNNPSLTRYKLGVLMDRATIQRIDDEIDHAEMTV